MTCRGAVLAPHPPKRRKNETKRTHRIITRHVVYYATVVEAESEEAAVKASEDKNLDWKNIEGEYDEDSELVSVDLVEEKEEA
jgi:hypothetical protein